MSTLCSKQICIDLVFFCVKKSYYDNLRMLTMAFNSLSKLIQDRRRIYIIKSLLREMSHLVGKPTICIGENKGADQLHGNPEAEQRLCFRYLDSTIPLLLKSEISSF